MIRHPFFFSGATTLCFLLALSCLVADGASAQDANSGQELHWCKRDNGTESAQLDPCAPGTEVRSSPAINGISEGLPVEPLPAGQSDDGQNVTMKKSEVAPDASADDAATLKQGQTSLLKYLAWGLLFGIAAKLFKRSFFLGFFFGFILRIVLVSADLINF